jgi:CubicO group peptidase (beta-lactamase class C family)
MYSSSGGPASRKNVFSAIAEHLFPFVNEGKISGAVAAIASKDCVLHLEALGKSDLSSGRALETDDLFWIASMSKPITALAVALLSDDGRLAFDD